MLRIRPVFVEDKDTRAVRAGNLLSGNTQINFGVPKGVEAAITRDRAGFNMNDFGMIN